MTRILPHILTTLPAACLVLAGLVLGGWWLAAALIWMIGFSVGFPPSRAGDSAAVANGWLPVLLGIVHFAILATAILSLARPAGIGHLAGGFLAAGLYLGQVSVPAAHELIHRSDRWSFALGKWVYISLIFGHHTSAHRLVHHVHVATDADPNSAAAGESLWHFLPRAWIGSFRAGLAAERRRSGGAFPFASYGIYLAGEAAVLALAAVAFGPRGVAAALALGLYATLQLLTTDYVQHYGLRRTRRDDGSFAPVGPAHAWDAVQRGPLWLMLNAPAHAAHHLHPQTNFVVLDSPEGTLRLPYSLAIMGLVAFLPRRWRRLMDPRLPAA